MATSQVHAKFMSEHVSSEILVQGMVPGLGDVAIQKLVAEQIKTPMQLVGKFLMFNCNEAEMLSWMVDDIGIRSQDAQKTVAGLVAKVPQFCKVSAAAMPGVAE
eukprot:CAMPEP_0175859020 /NCGR_PEP_ID=MMETSP0107_2-20121207/30020_1 /TAXON_ID=195067 ORGANISM="Goniomonas pacifica, Strain CCMP1869" /NCGR_SAMPLE_ID=MMETSP0107_2 /ASSEMBLY_ACC=CAM_ASM_000203 /LENGTH=103 /DNA_ID=CAMNT_0017175587 /DNA_START=7 /DNA_END=318 /DNA_ORIENTATION=+